MLVYQRVDQSEMQGETPFLRKGKWKIHEDSVQRLDVEKEKTVVSVVVHIGTLKFQAR